MISRLFAAVALLCVSMSAQVNVSPILQPHATFVDQSGAPCAGCTLTSYVAGTTTPTPTYTDSTGGVQNPNPIVLSVQGGANIWVNKVSAYKFVLKNTLGATVWTVDNVESAGGNSIVSSPSGSQTITQPPGTDFDVLTSSGGKFKYNGGEVITAAPLAGQTVMQPAGTTLAVNSLNSELNATLFPGADAGAKINAAYAALPDSGGNIIYPVATGGESYSTPIVFGTADKPAILSCNGASGADNGALIYTGSGVGITINTGPASNPNGPVGSGIRDCSFKTQNPAATLAFLGGSNGAEGAIVSDSKFYGGAITMAIGDNTWHLLLDHDYLQGGAQQFVTVGGTNAGENIDIESTVFGGGGFGTFTNGVVIGGGVSGPGLNLQCNSCSFDNTQLVVSGGIIELNSTHFEDPGNIVWPAPPYVQTGGLVSLNTATFFGDHPSAMPALSAYMAVSGGMLTTDSIDTFGCNCTNIYTSSGTGHIVGRNPLNLSGPAGAVVNLIADTSSEPSTVDGGREYGLHAESAYNIQGNMNFATGSFIHFRSLESTDNKQARTGTYIDNQRVQFVTSPDLAGYAHSSVKGVGTTTTPGCGSYSSNQQFFTENKSAANQTDTSTVAATLGCNKAFNVPAVISSGPTFTISGCSAATPVGGATAGQFNAGVAGTCTVTITIGNGIVAPNGWTCGRPTDISDPTKSGSWFQTAFTATTVTLSGTSGVGELIQFACAGY